MRRKATAAMRILGSDAGKDADALEAELSRMEERGQAANGPGRRKAEALRDLAAYKRAVGTKEVSAEEIAEGRQRDAEQRIIEGKGERLPSEDFYGRRQSRGNGDMPTKWTDAAKRPLERVARALRNVVTVGGKKLKVSFADRPESAENGADEALAESWKSPRVAESVEQASEVLRATGIIGKPLHNETLQMDAVITRNNLDKMTSEKATKKSASPRLHALAVANADTLYKSAFTEITHPDTHGRKEVVQTHRLGSLMRDPQTGRYEPVMLTVLEYGKYGNRVYSIEAVDLLKNKTPAGQLVDSASPAITPRLQELMDRIAQRAAEVNGGTRRSISGIFTGTAADYANRSRQGGVDDGPSVKKIGTGEGSQVYGWGLYGSTKRGVAEGYAKSSYNQRNEPIKVDGEIVDFAKREEWSKAKKAALDELNTTRNVERAIQNLEYGREYATRRTLAEHAIKYLREHKFGGMVGEHLYEQTFFTDRAPGDESHLLKWYEPVSEEQAKWIERRLKAERISLKKFDPDELGTRPVRPDELRVMKAGNLYQLVSNALGSPRLASEFLARAGIDGVKYPVDSYGGKGVKDGDKAGWNYVSFRDDNIRVDHKWTDGEKRYMRNGDGEVVGEYDADRGEIRLYPGATVADVVHEFTHPLVDFARAEDRAGRGELLGKIKEIIDAERATWEQPVRDAYADKGEGEILEEIFTHAMGDKGATLFGKSTTTLEGRRWYNRLWEAIKGVWQDFATKMGWNGADLRGLDKMSPEDAAQRILSEMARGRNFGDAVTGGEGARNAVRQEEYDRWNRVLDDYEAGNVSSRANLTVLDNTPSILRRIGANDLPITMRGGVLQKIVGEIETSSGERHGIPVSELRNLQIELDNPIAVFDSKTQTGSLVVLTRIVDRQNNEKAVVALRLDREASGSHTVNDIVSIYGKDKQSIENWTAWNLLRYINKQARRESARWLQLPGDSTLRARSVLTEKDFSGEELGRIVPQSAAVRKGVSPAEDEAYMDAVERGDMETAQRMVREAADRAGYGKIGFHGTTYKRGKFTTFQKGSHIGSEVYQALNRIGVETDGPMAKEQIDLIIEDLRKNGKDVLSLRVKLNNPLRISDFGDDWSGKDFVRRLYSEHPELFSNAEWAEMMKDPSRAHQMIEGKGYDGLVYDNGSEGILDYSGDTPGRYKADGTYIPNDSYIPFHPSQIKSADAITRDDAGNVIPLSQRFNPQREDIRYSRRVAPRNVPPAPTNQDIQDYLGGKDGFMRRLRRMFQDKNIVIRDVEERLGVTDKDASVYYAKDRAFGKNEHELTVLQKQEVKPIVEKIHKSGGSLELFSAYLYARHSGERNAALKASKGVENGSGMTKEQADTIFNAVDRLGLRAAFEDAAKDVWAMNRKYLKRRVDSGRMTQADYDFYTQRYEHYVPLRTDMTDEELDIFNSTTGGWKRNELMAAQGRRSAADDPLAFSIVQNEQAIRASNANEVRRRFAGLVRRSKGALGEVVDGVNKGGAKWSFTFGDGETVETGSPMRLASERDDIVLFKENGQLKAVKVNPGEHGRGIDLARAVTDKDVAQFNRHLEWLPRATRWMSAMRTQYVPTFIVRNMKADNLEVLLNALSERGVKDGAKFFGRFLKNEVSVAKGVKEYFKTGKSSDRFVQEAVENGLLTGGGMSAEGFTETARRLSDTLQALRERPKILGGAFEVAKDTISLLNACAEYNTRMGVYKTLREEGMSVADAVSYARDVTVNFNRKGYLTPYTNAAFMFSNAAIQGMGRAFKSMNSEHGKEVLAGMFLVGVAQALLDDWLGHDDESEKSGGADSRNLTEYDKSHSLGVALPTGHRVKTGIRNPWALPMYAGRKAVELLKGISSGEKVMKDLASEVGQFVTEPVGGNGFDSTSEFLQTLAPTIIDPFVQWGTGKDYRGQDRLKKSFDKYAPDSWNGKDSTPEAYKAVAKALNFISGGSEHRKGAFDVAPENVRLLTETVFGGVLTDLNNLVKGGEHAVDAVRGKPAAQIARDIPFVRDTFTNMPDNTSRFYAALDAYNADKAEFKKTTELGRRRDMKREKPYLTQGKGRVDTLIERVKELRHLERGEVKAGQKWVERKTPVPEERKRRFREQRLEVQAKVLKILGE